MRERECERERERKREYIYYKNYDSVLWYLPSYIIIFTIWERKGTQTYIMWFMIIYHDTCKRERERERESESEKEREGKTSVYYKNYERVLWHLPSYITIFTIRERRERLSDLWFLS